MEKKYKLTDEYIYILKDGVKLFRIEAVKNFRNVKKGDKGGFVENENNLSHDGDCWIRGNARVHGNSMVYGNAEVCGEADVFDSAEVFGNALVHGFATVSCNAKVHCNSIVFGDAEVSGDAEVCSNKDYIVFKIGGVAEDILLGRGATICGRLDASMALVKN